MFLLATLSKKSGWKSVVCCFGCEQAINPRGGLGGTPIMVYRWRQQAKEVLFQASGIRKVGISLVEVHVCERVGRVQRKSVLQPAIRASCS